MLIGLLKKFIGTFSRPICNRRQVTNLPYMPMRVDQVTLREIRMRLRAPFETSFGSVQDRRILLVEVSSDGLSRWAECTAMETPSFNAETIDVAWLMLRDYLLPLFLCMYS